jgi:hypothetical protein
MLLSIIHAVDVQPSRSYHICMHNVDSLCYPTVAGNENVTATSANARILKFLKSLSRSNWGFLHTEAGWHYSPVKYFNNTVLDGEGDGWVVISGHHPIYKEEMQLERVMMEDGYGSYTVGKGNEKSPQCFWFLTQTPCCNTRSSPPIVIVKKLL